MNKAAQRATTKASDDIKVSAETFMEYIAELAEGDLVDAGAQLKQAKDLVTKADKAIKARIISAAGEDLGLHGVMFKARIVEAIRWTLDSKAIKAEMGEEWCTERSNHSMSRSVRYGV